MDVEDVAYGFGLAGLDPAALAVSLRDAAWKIAQRPDRVAYALGELTLQQTAVALDVARTALGARSEPVVAPDPSDRRFAERAWTENPLLRGALESYLAASRVALDLLESAELTTAQRRKARFALRMLLDALAPSNVPWLNPAVVKEAIDTGGLSLVRGARNFLEDLVRNGARPRQVDLEPFEFGESLAATPGRIVFHNDLFELIAYEPQTETVHAQPFVYCPAWINKYYVMDLAPGRSFVEHAVQNGFTVFAISYRNPDASMAAVTMDDYLRDGLLTAIDRVAEITGLPVVNVVATCTGGTLATIALAVLAERGEAERVGWATLTVTLVDYSEPGEIGIFADEDVIEHIEQRNTERGYHDSGEMSRVFDWLRGNDLVWNYVVANWYQGKQPPPFDILAWNADATRLPAAMHGQFLRTCYLRNELVRPGAFVIDGTPVDVSRIETPLYVLGAERDHIAPWRSSYRTTQLVDGDVRHVLTSGGHIAGMVSPPGNPKSYYRVAGPAPVDADEWLRTSERVRGSWWEDWLAWAAPRSGEQVAPPQLPDGEPAPGRYVRG